MYILGIVSLCERETMLKQPKSTKPADPSMLAKPTKGESYHWKTKILSQAHEQARKKYLKLNQYLDQLVLKDAETNTGKSVQEELSELRLDLNDLKTEIRKMKHAEKVNSLLNNSGW